MKMQKKQFRIGELAKQLNVENFVIRFWEKEFAFKGERSAGGQRFYTQEDLERFTYIRSLLYDHGFTIAGAKKELKKKIPAILGSHKTTMDDAVQSPVESYESLLEQIKSLQEQLRKLRDLL